ncbi:phage tail protein [Chromobacterium sp. IIBBL 290-4]|uniref:phage tail protein n=1 Tax=Chromobacterium sp. IIBBL 290-4 TaxID=2953890 RepID=UPI0020B736E0|nr:phage tail protein [Chromobacterium sp. IIBBL 290-4]UTH73333.1 phage tail protein [Chromobacterium sp. IIBBL 290-4]
MLSLGPIKLPMMALGMFVFMMDTLPYQEFKQKFAWRWPSNSRVGRRPAYQFLGADEECITLSGRLLPELTGGDTALSLLKLMADQGKAWPLIEGTGAIYGFYVVESLDIGKQEFFSDGKARAIDFTLSLKRTDDSLLDALGALTRGVLELIK